MKYVAYTACMNTPWNQLPSKEIINQTAEALSAHGFNTIVVETEEEAKQKALELLPKNAGVMTMTSETLRALGLNDYINESGEYNAVRPKLMSMDRATEGHEMKKLGAAPEYVIGSVNALTEDGHVLIASRTGSQIPAYVYAAGHVVWVVGVQKIVKNVEEGTKRIFEYVLGLESERANKAYNITSGSKVDRLLTFYEEETPKRITIILVNRLLGF